MTDPSDIASQYGRLHAVLQHILLRRMLRPDDRALNALIQERLSIDYLCAWRRALAYRRAMRPERVSKVFLFSYSRSGSHNFVSRLHYLPELFVFREQAFCTEADPWQGAVAPGQLRAAHFLALSVFGLYGIQDKPGRDLQKNVFFNNRYLDQDGPPVADLLSADADTQVVFYLRNIFRVLYSRDKASERVRRDKSKWSVTDSTFERDVTHHRDRLREILRLHEQHPRRVKVVFNEVFCARPDDVFRDTTAFLGVGGGHGEGVRPQDFFRWSFGHRHPIEERDGRLWCTVRKAWVEGTGGNYNPLVPPDRRRAVSDPVEQLLAPRRLQCARQVFGPRLTEHWINDGDFAYDAASNEALIEQIRADLP